MSSPRKSKKQITNTDELNKTIPEPKPMDPTSIEGIVAKLLPPTVSESEVSEYQW